MLRVGIIGAGSIVRNAHAPAWRKLQDAGKAQVTAISDIFIEGAQSVALTLEHNGQSPKVYADFHELIADAPIDAVDICLPHHLHAQAILAAVKAGKHVICEKPMCISLAEADTIVEAVDNAGITYMSAHNELFYPAILAGRKAIEDGAIGKPFILRSHEFPKGYNRPSVPGREAQATNMVGWRASKETMGGGVLIDKGYHPTYILLALARSEPVSVTAMMNTFVAKMDGEDTAVVMVKFADGSIGQIFTGEGFAFPANDAKFHVIGSNGEVYGMRTEAHILPRGYTSASTLTETLPAGMSTFDAEMIHFVDAIETKRKPIQDQYDGRRVLEVIQAAYRSAEAGETVDLPLKR